MSPSAARTLADYDTESLAARYAQDGVATVGPLLTHEEVAEVRFHVSRYNRYVIPNLPQAVRDKTVRYEDDGVSLRSCYFMDQVDEYFNELGNRPFFKQLVAAIVGYEPELYVVETFNKYARVGSSVAPHQDCVFLPVEPMDVVHLWIALTDATEENGAVKYWTGSHLGGLLPHVPAPFGLKVRDDMVDHDAENTVRAVLPAGSAAIHSGLVVHDSPPNRTDQPRLGMLLGYRGAHTRHLLDQDWGS
ncbi:phytanoyl-CoA dioxygenase family protein [Streptomyces sp. NPDC059456]|uniref:phytanoyl-CoA dioxygenase family protein n=1 Tax=Streptomyces sp. NPDC059456 TaxID=3346838 RepID=UPI00369DC203